MGSTKVKVEQTDLSEIEEKTSESEDSNSGDKAKTKPKARKARTRSKAYVAARAQVDKTKTYPLSEALDLVKRLSKPSHPTLTADINLKKGMSINEEVVLPHSNGKEIKVAIADDKVLSQIEAGNIDFDVLLAEPSMMGKIAKHARVLGPRGLMPNPKNNTVVDDPKARKAELENNALLQLKTEKKAPLLHLQIGSVANNLEQAAANLLAVVKKVGINKVSRVTVSSTMSPGVKVDLSSLVTES